MPPQTITEPNLDDRAVQKTLRAKEAQRKAFLKKRAEESSSSATCSKGSADPRLPPNQRWVKKGWPVIDIRTSDFSYDPLNDPAWRLEVEGLCGGEGGGVDGVRSFSLAELQAAGREGRRGTVDEGEEDGEAVEMDLHCVTQASVKGLRFVGVPMSSLLALFKPRKDYRFLLQYGRDGYAANVPREEVERDDVFFAWAMEDESGNQMPIPDEHGGARILYPQLYGWKGVKWPVRIRFSTEDEPGFWERRGGHERGRHDAEERFDMTKVSALGPWAMRVGGKWFRSERMRPFALFAQRSMGRYFMALDRLGAAQFFGLHAAVVIVVAVFLHALATRLL